MFLKASTCWLRILRPAQTIRISRSLNRSKRRRRMAFLLQAGDRLAIFGDSITEQKMYSRIIETYLTVCVPELDITVRQFGWSGESAEGFLRA